jgi:uncharacterized protein (DUF2141 family)
MKPLSLRLLAATAAIAFSGAASAADTASLSVSATVQGVCKFAATAATAMSITSPTLAFLDPSLTTDGKGTSTVSYRCTKNSSPTLQVGTATTSPYNATGTNGLVNGSGASAVYMPFSIAWTAPSANSGAGFSAAASTVTLTGTILNANYVDMPAGNYTASVPLSITP